VIVDKLYSTISFPLLHGTECFRSAGAMALAAIFGRDPTRAAQKAGGISRIYRIDTPPTLSILEEATLSFEAPVMGIFNTGHV